VLTPLLALFQIVDEEQALQDSPIAGGPLTQLFGGRTRQAQIATSEGLIAGLQGDLDLLGPQFRRGRTLGRRQGARQGPEQR
jgi:hypothetical protein